MAPAFRSARRALALLLVAITATTANAGGFLREPTPRNVLAFNNQTQASGNSKGPQPYLSRQKIKNGPCGDPFQDLNSNIKDKSGPPQATYTTNATIDLTVDITANYGGYFEFRLCPQRTSLQNVCFESIKLKRCVLLSIGLLLPPARMLHRFVAVHLE
jgi:hypothetical protein